jgi:small redox-active disulfide protein 2
MSSNIRDGPSIASEDERMVLKIEVLTSTCAKCKMLEVVVRTAIREMEIEADIKNIHEVIYIREKGVTRIPALMINNKLILEGRVPTVTEMKGIIKDEMLDISYG